MTIGRTQTLDRSTAYSNGRYQPSISGASINNRLTSRQFVGRALKRRYIRLSCGLFPRLTTWIGFNEELLLKAYHRDFTGLLAPHFSRDVLEDLECPAPERDVGQRIERLVLPLNVIAPELTRMIRSQMEQMLPAWLGRTRWWVRLDDPFGGDFPTSPAAGVFCAGC